MLITDAPHRLLITITDESEIDFAFAGKRAVESCVVATEVTDADAGGAECHVGQRFLASC